MNLCRACGLDFGSGSAFDAHRTGTHEYVFSPDRPEGRRCLAADELRDNGWSRDRRGRWRRPRQGAPWTNQVRTQKPERGGARGSGRLRRATPPTPVPESQAQPERQ